MFLSFHPQNPFHGWSHRSTQRPASTNHEVQMACNCFWFSSPGRGQKVVSKENMKAFVCPLLGMKLIQIQFWGPASIGSEALCYFEIRKHPPSPQCIQSPTVQPRRPIGKVWTCGRICAKLSPLLEGECQACAQLQYEPGHILEGDIGLGENKSKTCWFSWFPIEHLRQITWM